MKEKLAWILTPLIAILAISWFLLPRIEPEKQLSEAKAQREPSNGDDATTTQTTLISARPKIDRVEGYLGSDSCKKCHEDYYQSWHTSYHHTMTQFVTPETAPPEMVNGKSITLQGKTYKFSREGDDLFVELNDPIADDRLIKRRLVMMTGSHHAHVFWYESGYDQTPAQLQAMYLIAEKRWIPRRSFFLRPPTMAKENELGRWNAICSNCHSVHPRNRPDDQKVTWETKVVDFGITCEACHGPGQSHVAYHERAPSEKDDAKDPIVNPLSLPKSKRSDMCGQCHGMMMVGIDNAQQQEQFFTEGRSFRPGQSIHDAKFLRVVQASEEHRDSETFQKFDAHQGVTVGHFWPDGQMRVTGRDYTGMIESKCFQKGDLSCMTCHTMHQQDPELQAEWKNDQLIPDMRGDASCLQCHPKYKELGSQHTHHPVDSHGSRCMNCHMPKTIYGIQKTSRSHTISSPSVAVTKETGRPNACNLCHLDHTLQQTADSLAQWYDQDKPTLSEIEKTTAASIVHVLSGDAAQRVLQFNAFQWQPAREASGTQWMRMYFLLGMEDPYDAIRLVSERGYKSLPNAPKLDYDFLASPSDRAAVFGPQYQNIMRQRQRPNPALLIDSQGYLDQRRMGQLMKARNQRPVYLQE